MFVILSLGSNLGNRQANIQQALEHLAKKVLIKKISSFYESSPVDYFKQNFFLNICVAISTPLPPFLLLDLMQKIEKKLKRKKIINKGPRNIDIDIIFYNNQIIKHSILQIPHPNYQERLFVLLPLLEITKNQLDPQTKRSIYFYYNKSFPRQFVRKIKTGKRNF